MRENLTQFVKYGLVGLVNTALTFASYWLFKACGLGVDLANLLSFTAGMLCSFVLNKLWTFRARGSHWWRESLLFFAGAGLCWGLQWWAFRGLLLWLPEILAQIGGMAVYTILNFLFNKTVTFKKH